MVATKLIVELVVVVVTLAVALWWLWTNYSMISEQFFSFLNTISLGGG